LASTDPTGLFPGRGGKTAGNGPEASAAGWVAARPAWRMDEAGGPVQQHQYRYIEQ